VNEVTETERIVNRHIARLLTDLERANCPSVYVQAVKSELTWLRSDLKDMEKEKQDERCEK
jgi:hypothetical protein